ncbi:protein rolling stone-like [Asterias rubens]|uniref:protein rolling stone-like n=1 Tax=Asterias rubens TaxID=7604 RepID=UPI0014553490|nr:protein rolling stone-like [Asterias rubens]
MERCAECCSRPKLSDLGFQVEDSSVFYRPQWSKIPWFVFVIYRVVLALYFLGYYLGDSIQQGETFSWRSFLYLTTLAFIVFIIYLVMAAVVAFLDGFISRKRSIPGMRIRHKLQWFLFNTTFSVNVIVVVTYWAVLYSPSENFPVFNNINVHLLTAVISLLDLLLTATPVRYLHVIYPILFGLSYLAITLINWAAGGDVIYFILDYSNYPGLAAGTIIGVITGVFIIHGVVWGLYKLRMWIWGRFGNIEIVDDEIKIEEAL